MTKRLLLSSLLLLLLIHSPLLAVDNSRPWTFWYWMYGAVSRDGIRADLQSMKDIGLGGCYLMPIRGVADQPKYGGRADQLSPAFWSLIDYAFQQADSLGLDMGIHICDGFALGGHPAITPAESMQKVVWADTIVKGGHVNRLHLPRPQAYQGYYEDIATYAVRYPEPPRQWQPAETMLSPQISTKKGYMLASQPCSIIYRFDRPVMVRSVEIMPEGNNVQSQRLLVEASDDGIAYRGVRQLTPPRQGWQNTNCGYTYSLPPTKARYFRFSWTPAGTEPGAEDLDAAKWKALLKLRTLTLSNAPVIDNYEGKAGFVWRMAQATTCDTTTCQSLLLSTGDSVISTTLPKGYWRIIRMGHTSTGKMNETGGGGKGLEVDKFSEKYTKKLIGNWFGRFMARPHHNVVKYMHVDSWECGTQNWGENFPDEFRQRYGYDLRLWLPVMAGIPIAGREKCEKVLRDVRCCINDLVNEKFFKTLTDEAHRFGVSISHESIAPTFIADGLTHFKYADIPMGEYWFRSPTHDKPCDMLDAISGAHIYGKNIVQAEGFTEVRGTWDETPAMLKPLLDLNFCKGMNRLFFHVNAHNPWLDRKPGMTLDGIGLFFQRDNTWYGEAKGLTDYAARCQRTLQQGQPVVDIAVFTGEEMPSRSLTPDRLVGMLPGLFGQARISSEQQRLRNEGQPMTESPVGVIHSGNIFNPDHWANALHGYHYDCINPDALLASTADNGALVTPGGMRYRILVLPEIYAPGIRRLPLSDRVGQKIETLRKAGITVIDKPYTHCDFTQQGVAPDVILPDSMDFYHRREVGQDIYFLASQQSSPRRADISVRGEYPFAVVENPLDGSRYALSTSIKHQRTAVSLSLPAYGSALVYFSANPLQANELLKIKRETAQPLIAKWHVHFNHLDRDSLWDGKAGAFDWSKSSEVSMAYYSGTVSMTAKMQLKTRHDRTLLRLNGLRDVAHVFVNGTDCGIVWTAPYEADITKALRKGSNEINIKVTNTWHNALMGADKGLPPFKGIWTNARYRDKSGKLLSAGILGDITIINEDYE